MFTRDKSFYRSFFTLTLALMAEQAVILSVNLADNIMLGTYSESALSGVAAVNQIQFVLQQIVYGVSNGVIVLGSQYWGKKRPDAVKKLSAIGLWCNFAITLSLFILVSLFPQGALRLFTNDEAIITQGVAYLNIMRFSYVCFGFTAVMLSTMRIAETVKHFCLHLGISQSYGRFAQFIQSLGTGIRNGWSGYDSQNISVDYLHVSQEIRCYTEIAVAVGKETVFQPAILDVIEHFTEVSYPRLFVFVTATAVKHAIVFFYYILPVEGY